jgi:hypothetical protein
MIQKCYGEQENKKGNEREYNIHAMIAYGGRWENEGIFYR